MADSKQCRDCMEIYPEGHWASSRERCPACGGPLATTTTGAVEDFHYEHYDSSADICFDLRDLLSPEQLREVKLILGLGLGLLALAFAARVGFVVLGRLGGFWLVPLWFDAIVALMLLLSALLIVWAVRRLVRHRRVLQRDGG